MITPAWMLGQFNDYYRELERNQITERQFYIKIKDLPEVPNTVKETWRQRVESD